MGESKLTSGAIRAAGKIMDIIHSEMGKTDTEKGPGWDLAQKDLAELIDQETAAPELLEALEAMLDTHRVDGTDDHIWGTPSVRGDWMEARRKSVAVIAKAKGEVK